MSRNKEKFIIIDGNALIHRSFHAIPPTMSNKDGEITNAIYGFTTVLIKALREFKPKYVVLTLDKKGPTFRHKQYKEYKAKRVKAPDELYKQIPRVQEVAEAFGIPVFQKQGFEADDLIGTLTHKINSDIEKIIVTGDMDTLQLIDKNTKVYTMSRGLSDSVLYGEKEVIARYKLKPDQMIDYKALRGDPSDNIPGVRGIGEKGAIELLKNFKTLDGIYKNIKSNKIKDRIRNLLLEHKDDAYMSRELATIKCDVPIKFKLEDARFSGFKQKDIFQLFSDLEFKSLLPRVKELLNQFGGIDEQTKKLSINKFERNKKNFKYHLITKEKDFEKFLNKLKKQKEFTFDTETSSFDPITSNLLGISFSWSKGEAYYLKCKNQNIEIKDNLFNYNNQNKKIDNKWLKKLKPIFENEKIKKNAHNAKFDIRVMKNNGIEVKGLDFDTMIASYLLNPGSRQHNLDALTFSELGFEKISKEDLLGKGKDKITFSEVNDEKLSLYSCEDADFTNRLKKKLAPIIKKEKMDKLFKDLEMPLVEVLAQIEENGIRIDKKVFRKLSNEVDRKIKNLEKKIWKIAGVNFNIKSTQQLKKVLFEKLEIPTIGIAKTKTGFSTAADELEKLKDEHKIIPLIQEYRELTKLFNTYIETLPKLENPKTKRIHTSFNQTITATGRLSSTDPNLQNIPVRTKLGREIRKGFVASPGNALVGLDYSQIELRLAAHISGDKKMIKAFKENLDIHAATAAEINRVKLEDVTKQMRREAKAINFGILYGQGPHGLSQVANIPYGQAKDFIDKYFSVYKDIKKYIDTSIKSAREKGYAETLFGRKRYLPEINSSIAVVRKGAERMAINAPLQGSSADMIKMAMIKVSKLLKEEKDAIMILQVHDELIFEIKKEKVKKISKKIKKIMEEIIKLKVPVIVDVSMGENWGEFKKIEI